MTQEQIHASLDKMLENPKAKTFLNHLVRAYMTITNLVIVMEKPKNDFKCVLTRETLLSVKDIKNLLDEKEGAFFNDNLKKALDNKNEKDAVEKLLDGKKLGVTGKETTTFMTYPAWQSFVDWVLTKALNGDKHINWLLGGIRRASFIERAESINDAGVQRKVDNFKNNGKPKVATFSLSDSTDVLSKLKAELEAKGK
jgi:Zn-dependent M16 (insulinase) family peptidase